MSETKTILVVDDDPDIVEQITLLLEGSGFNVASAHGQEEAEELIGDVIPDLAIVDLMMETMDSGFILSHHLKQRFPSMPVIILTAVTADTGLEFDVTTPEERSWIKADLLVDKPVRPEQILGHVNRLLEV